MNDGVSLAHLGLLKVEVLADGSEQSAQTLQRLLIVILKQFDNTVVHDGFSQHLELEQLTDELNVADRTPPSLVLCLLQLFLEPLALRRLKPAGETPKRYLATGQNRRREGSKLQFPASRTDAVESSSFCLLSNTTSSTLSFSNSFWQRFSSNLRKLTEEVGFSVMGTLSYKT